MNISGKAALLAAVILAEATVAVAQSGGGRGANDKDRLICRRTPETGSLVRVRRQCFTKAEWDRIAESQQAGARRTIEGLNEKSSGN